MLAALTMLMIDRNFDGIFFADGSGGAPLLWQHLSWIFYTGAYMLILIAALGAIAEIVPTFAGKPLFNRGATIGSLVGDRRDRHPGLDAEHADRADRDRLDVLRDDHGAGADRPLRPGDLQPDRDDGRRHAADAGAAALLGRVRSRRSRSASARRSSTRWSRSAWQLKNTTDATAATHFALIGGSVFGGFAALHYWFPKMTGRTMGESLARISFWTMAVGILAAFVPALPRGGDNGEVVDAYKFFDGTGVNTYNLIASIGSLVLAIGIVTTLVNAILSRGGGAAAGHDPWGGDSLEWFALSPPEPHNFDVLPDVRSAQPMRDIREAIAHRTGSATQPERESQPVA